MIELHEEDFSLPISKQGSHDDQDVELTILLRTPTMAKQVMKQILRYQIIAKGKKLPKRNKENVS